MTTVDNGTGVGAHYWTVTLTPPAQAPTALRDFVAMAQNAIQMAVDLLGRRAPELPPGVDDLMTPTIYQSLGTGEADKNYKAILAAVDQRRDSLLGTDQTVLQAAITVSARSDTVLQTAEGVVDQLQTELKSITGKLTAAQTAALMQQIGYAVDVVNAQVTSVYEANHGTARSHGANGGGTGSGAPTPSSPTDPGGSPANHNANNSTPTNPTPTTNASPASETAATADPTSSLLQNMEMQQALQGFSQKPSNRDQSAGDAANSSGTQQGSQSTTQDATYQTGGSQTGTGAPASATSAQPVGANGSQFPTKTIDGVSVQLSPVVWHAVDNALNWHSGCDGFGAYGNTAGDPSTWTPADPNDLHTGDVIAWDDRSAIIVRDSKGLFMINNGKLVPLDPSASFGEHPPGFLHPPVPVPPDVTQPVVQNASNRPATVADAIA
ncbi:hypothetical protein ABIA39_006247 [Nocardia sp. GAS34]|uniref:hypothetical protein n=1 Tax=unclassified Nocardia TaxID=2637762 RepID=UPI003D19337F